LNYRNAKRFEAINLGEKKKNIQNENISQICTIKSQPPTEILIENYIFT